MACSLIGKGTHLTHSSHRISGERPAGELELGRHGRAPVQSQCSVALPATLKIVRLKARGKERRVLLGEDEGLNCKSKLFSWGELANTLLLSLSVCMAHKSIFALHPP